MSSETLGQTRTEVCRECRDGLVPGLNWPISRQKTRNRICTPCFSAKTRKWEAENPERHRAGNNARNRRLNKTTARRVYCRERAREKYRDLPKRGPRVGEGADGHIYVVSNPAFPGKSKIGLAKSPARRLNNYQTGSPFRDYRMDWISPRVKDRGLMEAVAHTHLSGFRILGTEWFSLHPDDAAAMLSRLIRQEDLYAEE